MEDITVNVQILDFGNSIPAAVTANDDGSYSIFINARISYENRIQAYQHELRHILNHDFDTNDINNATVNEIELSTHDEREFAKDNYI